MSRTFLLIVILCYCSTFCRSQSSFGKANTTSSDSVVASTKIQYPVLLGMVQFSPDGKMIGATTSDSALVFWDANTGALIKKLTGLSYIGYRGDSWIVFLPDGHRLLAFGASDIYKIHLIDTASGEIRVFESQGYIYCVSHSGAFAVGVGLDSSIKVWEIASGSVIKSMQMDTSDVRKIRCISISNDDKQIVVNINAKPGPFPAYSRCIVYDAVTYAQKTTIVGAGNMSVFRHDGSAMYSVHNDSLIRVWDPQTWQQKNTWVDPGKTLTTVRVSYDDKRAATFTSTALTLWNTSTGASIKPKYFAPGEQYTSIEYSPTEHKLLLLLTGNKTVKILSLSPPDSAITDVWREPATTGDDQFRFTPSITSSQTEATYTLSSPQEVSVTIYDNLGNRVAEYPVGHQESGEHRVVVDCSSLASGKYFCVLRAGERRITRAVIVKK